MAPSRLSDAWSAVRRARDEVGRQLRRIPGMATAVKVQQRAKDDRADQHAAAIAFFGFLSLFPLLLLVLSVTGMFLAGDPAAQNRFANGILRSIPGFEASFGQSSSAVRDAVAAVADNAGNLGLVGLATMLVTGMKVVASAHRATLSILHVEVHIAGLKMRLRQLAVLGGLGVVALVGVASTALVGAASRLATDEAASIANELGGGGRVTDGALQLAATIAGLIASLGVDFVLFLLAYRWLSYGRGPHVSQLWPGAVLAAVGWTGLKVFGATYVTGQIARTSASIGALGGVVGLLLLLYLAGRVFVYGLELATVVRNPGPDLAARYAVVRLDD